MGMLASRLITVSDSIVLNIYEFEWNLSKVAIQGNLTP